MSGHGKQPAGGRSTPPKASPEAGDNPGYAEDEPRDVQDTRLPHGRDARPSPDEGGMTRDPDDPGATEHPD